jgi:hypothetical protein
MTVDGNLLIDHIVCDSHVNVGWLLLFRLSTTILSYRRWWPISTRTNRTKTRNSFEKLAEWPESKFQGEPSINPNVSARFRLVKNQWILSFANERVSFFFKSNNIDVIKIQFCGKISLHSQVSRWISYFQTCRFCQILRQHFHGVWHRARSSLWSASNHLINQRKYRTYSM